jgi:hypothetical protein
LHQRRKKKSLLLYKEGSFNSEYIRIAKKKMLELFGKKFLFNGPIPSVPDEKDID